MKLTSQRCTRFLLGALCIVVVAHPAFGQSIVQGTARYGTGSGTVPVLNQGEGIAVGPFLFSPAVQLIWEYRDNIFFTAYDKKSDHAYVARARLLFELPVYNTYVRFSYTPQWREFQDYELPENWSHFIDVSGDFEFASGFKLDASYSFASANLETQLVDPGGELVLSGRQFDRHNVRLTGDYWVTERDGLTVLANYIDLKYQEREGAPFPDYDENVVGAGWLHQVNPTAVLDVTYRHIEFEPKTEYYLTGSTGDEVTVGITGQVTPLLSAEFSLGYRSTTYELAPGYPEAADFHGLVMDGYINYVLAHHSSLRLRLLRSPYPSLTGNAFYTATAADLTYSLRRDRLFGNAQVRYQTNSYDFPDPTTGLDREDKITTLGFGVGYRLHQLFSLQGSYRHEDRDSLEPYKYDTRVFLLGLIFGF